MNPDIRHQILDQLVTTCHVWLSYDYKPGHGQDKLMQIYRLWKPAWDEGLVQDRSMVYKVFKCLIWLARMAEPKNLGLELG